MLQKILVFIKNFMLKTTLAILKTIKYVLNLDVGFIFLFFATYLFNSTYPWHWRLLGCFGLYMIYKMLLKDYRGLSK